MNGDRVVDEVEGECPQCRKAVKVYADGGKLVVREHFIFCRIPGYPKSRRCTAKDGQAALGRRGINLADAEAKAREARRGAQAALAAAETALTNAIAASADYATKVAALTGVTPTVKPAGEP